MSLGQIIALIKAFGGGGGGGSSLPTDPASDGTYVLQNTVSSGAGTLSWGSGGGGDFVVIKTTGVQDMDSGDVTIESIDADAVPDALAAGKVPVLWVDITAEASGEPAFTAAYVNVFVAEGYKSVFGEGFVIDYYDFNGFAVAPNGTVTQF